MRHKAPFKKMDFTKLLQTPPTRTDFNALDGAMGALMGVALGAFLTDALKPTPEAQPQSPPSANPYRGSQTVGDIEKALLQEPSSHRRENALRELAKYPESLPFNQLPAQTMHLLSGR